MIRYAFDLYPSDDPRDGTLLRRFQTLQEASYRGEGNGTGSGTFKVRGDGPDAFYIDPAGLQYVRVVEIDEADAERVVGGFFLEEGDFTALSEKENQPLTFSGTGVASYLQREVMWSHTYLEQHPDIFSASDPFDDTWRLYSQGPAAGGDLLGAVLWRVIWEGQHFDSVHADDRPESAIPAIVLTFDGFEDSDGNPWTIPSGEFKAAVGENLLDVTARLMQAGLFIHLDPDTFELSAWETEAHRRDRTGGAWGASVVRFQAPTGGDIATGNIKDDARRKIRANIRRSAILAGGSDIYALGTGSSPIPWHGAYRLGVDDLDASQAVADTQLIARSDASDNLTLRIRLGDNPGSGYYLPWDHIQPLDTVTVHTGTSQWDYNEAEFPVAALTIRLRKGGDWDAFVELGATYSSLLEPAFNVAPPAAHSHPLPFCTVPVDAEVTPLFVGQCNGVGADYLMYQASVADAGDVPCAVTDGSDVTWTQLAAPVGASYTWIAADFLGTVSPTAWRVLQFNNQHGTGADEMATTIVIESSDDWGGPSSPGTGTWTVRDTIVLAGMDTGVISFSGGSHRYWRIRGTAGGAGGWVVCSWDLFGAGPGGDGTDQYTGTSTEIARCDHKHHLDDLPDLPDVLTEVQIQALIDVALAAYAPTTYHEPMIDSSGMVMIDSGGFVHMHEVPAS